MSEQETPKDCSANTGCSCVDGSVNIPVMKVQQFLANKYGKELMPKTFESGEADGECGPETRMMIMKYQSENKLKCDACVGAETGASMFPDMDLDAVPAATVASKVNTNKEIPKSGPANFTSNESFPLVNGRNFILPIEGKSSDGHANFSQPRGSGIHAAIDVFAPVGTPIRAIADGRIVMSNQARFEGYVKNLVDLCNKRNKEGKLLDDVNAAMGYVVQSYKNNKNFSGAKYRQKFIDKLNNKYQQSKIPDAPNDWNKLREWGDNVLVPKAMPALLRWYRKNLGLQFPLGGIGITLLADKDQHGNQFSFYYGHCDEVIIPSGRVKAGDVIGTVGNTAIFDKGGEHLHFHIAVGSDKGRKIPNSGAIRGIRRIDPVRAIPGYGDSSGAVYSGPAVS